MSIKAVFTSLLTLSVLASGAHAQSALSGPGCPGSGFRSFASDFAYTMTVVNDSPERVDVYWSDFDGNSIFYKTLFPGQSYDQQTYSSHSWLFWQTGRCEYHITMPTADQTIFIR